MPEFNGDDLAERDAMLDVAKDVQAFTNQFQEIRQRVRREAQFSGANVLDAPLHLARVDYPPPDLPEPLVTPALGYRSSFHEEFEISATAEQIRLLNSSEETEPPDSDEYESLSSGELVPAGEDPFGSEFDSESEDKAEDVGAPRSIQYPLHARGVNCNGRLPIEDPRFVGYNEMEEPATQESTQPFLDPRRIGNHSMLNDQDEADCVAILHPTSPAAFKAVEFIAKSSPQHILQNHDESHVLEEIDDSSELRGAARNGQHHNDSEARDLRPAPANGIPAQDIALRLSSRVQDVCLGWTFGRSPGKCDMLISDRSQAPKISSLHFRIHINAAGVMMLEDNSMNGTFVDETWLCKKQHEKDPGIPTRRMLSQGAVIRIMTVGDQKDGIRFVVGIPRRDHLNGRWAQKLSEYLGYVAQMQRQKEAVEKAAQDGNGFMLPPPVAMNAIEHGKREDTPLSANALQALTAGTEQYSHGMHWPGGEKYNVVGYVGKGAFALVYKLATKSDGEIFAAKQLEKRRFMKDGILDQKINNELLIMKDLRHDNIVKYVDHHELPQYLYIIMEYVPHGDLLSFINSETVMPEFLCQIAARQVCSALDYLHKRKITHRDIKPDNILIASHEPFVVKLSDFGLSKVVANEETFLRTFCGTLLYCAPEVYPGYDRFMAGKRGKRRRDEPPPRTSPYKQSVDIWAFAAVLFHLLCGTPPWTGSAEDRGALMLETVMTVPADYSRLRHAGVSDDGVDFLERMLITEPGLRATEIECLRHPWLSSKAEQDSWDQYGMEMDGGNGLVTIEENEEELDASQLSLNDKPTDQEIEDSDEEFLSDVDELLDIRDSKRFKSQHERGPDTVMYPRLPNMQGVPSHTESTHPPGNRLFGEIGASALRSSGVLGYDAHAALEMPMEGNHDDRASASNVSDSDYSRDSEDMVALQYYGISLPAPGPNLTGSAPSLFGAEALVGQLNMASPESGTPGPSASTSAAPTTPKTRGPSPLSNEGLASKRPSQEVDDTTPKRAKPSQSEVASRPSVERSTHQSVSGPRDAEKHKTPGSKQSNSPSRLGDNSMSKDQASEPTEHKPITRSNKKAANEKPTEQAKEKGSTKGAKDVAGVSTSHPYTKPGQDPNQGSSSSSSSASSSASASRPKLSKPFTKPPPRLGTLAPMPGSIHTPTIKLGKRITTYGRDPGSDFQHRDGLDTRIPKCALDIIFWRPGLEAQLIENPDLDWTAFDDLYAIVSTRTSQNIWINGVVLRKGDGCWKFGKLHTGDVVTIFDPVGKEGKELEFLKFKCEFSVGASKEARKEGSPFKVEKEEEKYLKWQMKKSRGGSVSGSGAEGGSAGSAGSLGGTPVAGGTAAGTAAAGP